MEGRPSCRPKYWDTTSLRQGDGSAGEACPSNGRATFAAIS
jgi:hypothetical protein